MSSEATNTVAAAGTIVVAVCGNPRKYQQSFTALMRAAETHNACLEAKLAQASSAPESSTTDHAEDKSAATECFFRFLSLHYDGQHDRMFLSTSAAPRASSVVVSEVASAAAVLVEEPAADVHVHVILHKVASFGTPRAAAAMNAWAEAQRQRHHSRLPVVVDGVDEVEVLNSRAALYALLDTVPETCIARTYTWAPKTAASPLSTPREQMTCVGAQSAVTLGDSDASRRLANGLPSSQWWIIKPDEGSGPAYTHHLVMWCTDKAPTPDTSDTSYKPNEAPTQPSVPVAVQTVLPTAAQPLFIVQELYTSALPIVLKVYCIGPHVFVKVSPTVKMLSMLRSGSTGLNIPVFMDSQDKELFTGTGLPTASSSQSPSSRRNSRGMSLTPSGDYSAGSPTITGMTVLGNATAGISPRQHVVHCGSTASLSSSSVPLEPLSVSTTPAVDAGVSLAGASAATFFESVVPMTFWDAWLAPGTPARERVESISADLRRCLGLGLFGFDILLVPSFLAHPYQRARCPVGFGEAVKPCAAEKEKGEERDRADTGRGHREGEEEGGVPLASTHVDEDTDDAYGACAELDGDFWGPEAMFDLTTGEPTPLLTHSIPCVIDVNYFPGFKGWKEANDNMLALMAQQVKAVEMLRQA